MAQDMSSHGSSPAATQEPLSELVVQSSLPVSEAGRMPEQSLQPADTLPASQPEGPEHQTSQIDPQHLSLQAENPASSTCEGLSAADITAVCVKRSSDTYLPHTALLDASATMEQDHPLILQQRAADGLPESAGQLMTHHTGLDIDIDIASTRDEEGFQQKHSIAGSSAAAPAAQDAGRHGQPSFASLDAHAATANPSAAAGGVRDEGALAGHSLSSVAAHDLASIPTDAAGPPFHHRKDLEGTKSEQSSALPAQEPSSLAERGRMPQAQSSSAQHTSVCCGVHDRSDQVSAAKQVVSPPASSSAAAVAADAAAHALRSHDQHKAHVCPEHEQIGSVKREVKSQSIATPATAEVNERTWSEHSQTAEPSDVPGSVVECGDASMTGRGTAAAEAAASDAESQSATQEELLALASAVAQLEARLADAQESASRLEQEAHAVQEEAAQWRDREVDASAQVQLLHARMTVSALAVQPSL